MGSLSSFQNIKDLKFVFTLGSWIKPFSQNGNQFNTITLQGLRASVNIENAGGAMMGTLNASIYGLPLDHVNKLTSLMWKSPILASSGNPFPEFTVQVYTVDGTQESLLFNGEILNAWADFSGMPEVALLVQANVGYSALVNPSSPLSIPQNATIGTVMGQLANKMGFSFECKDSTLASQVISAGSYYGNTAMEQARSLEDAYRFWMYQDATTDPPTLAITPWGKARQSLAVLLTPQTGLIGYPLFNSSGVTFSCYYNPNILFGGPVQISGSNVEQANTQWIVTSMSHQLSSQTPNGPWQSSIQAVSGDFGQLFNILGGGRL